jgi:hypothetical protein
MKKVSFDFDSTLSITKIEEFAKELVDRGFEVWIVTTRKDNNNAPSPNWNDDLFDTALRCGIPTNNIHFTNMKDKWEFLKDKGFLFHIDDNWVELKLIQKHIPNTKAISSFGNPKWKHRCIKAIGMNVSDFE